MRAQEGAWKRSLAALWLAQFMAVFGFSFVFPFLPLYLHQDLGIRGPANLALLSGIATGATGGGLALMSPIWGILADRHGRKPMLLRAMVLGGITVGLMGLSQNPPELIALRFLQGAVAGTVAASTALVASEAPRARVGWALGVLGSAVAVGGAVGPLVGGLLAATVGLRLIFLGGGVLAVLGALPVVIFVQETQRLAPEEAHVPALTVLRAAGPGAIAALAVLVAGQGLLQISYNSTQPLIVLRLIKLLPSGATAVTGIAFATAGLATGISAVTYSRLAAGLGYRTTAAVASALLAMTITGAALAPTVVLVVVAVAVFGLFYGVVSPCLSSMIGLEAPVQVRARVFGISSSAYAIGLALGPSGTGALASRFGISPALFVAAGTGLLLAGLLALRGREPAH